ncbi:bifunctional 5,10-methylenetetrahydrofolate dehydrogenase/5,10-methenyltetrahydrofolate cyclohydrolase [Patescibacteria group bacterium]|nr:bifunctional 5,10-methylenetetrahydrofolate dehydrogenase/5,10-methenyltetrahydrofolate cyclohydrolase [Patescibacteria group bacterium]
MDGKKLSEKILEKLRREIKKKRLKLKLTIVLVGENLDSKIFIKQKKKACEKVGIDFELFKFSSKISNLELKKEIKKIVQNPDIKNIVVQLSLPKGLNTEEILNLIPKEKNAEIVSPVVCAVDRILKEYKISLKNKKIVLIGKGRLVGRPVANWLKKQNLKFLDINKIKNADIVISGAGKPNLIKGEMVKKGVIVIDIGKDVDFKSVSKKASYITPTPGGVGPVTVACLLQNLI